MKVSYRKSLFFITYVFFLWIILLFTSYNFSFAQYVTPTSPPPPTSSPAPTSTPAPSCTSGQCGILAGCDCYQNPVICGVCLGSAPCGGGTCPDGLTHYDTICSPNCSDPSKTCYDTPMCPGSPPCSPSNCSGSVTCPGSGSCQGQLVCASGGNCYTDCTACPLVSGLPVCGNGSCEPGESCSGCPGDCGCSSPPPPPGSCYSSGIFRDTYTTRSCVVTISHLGWDNSDGAIGGYANASNGSWYRTINMNDSDLSCKPNINLQFTNNWGASGGRNFSLTNTINSKDAGNTLGAGWQLNSFACTINDCSTTQVGPSQRTTNSGSNTYTATLYYCGDGQCICGENSFNCSADCGLPVCYDSPSPPPGDTYNFPTADGGTCNIAITHSAYDNTDGAIGGYLTISSGSNYRTFDVNDSTMYCKAIPDFSFTNSWARNAASFQITTALGTVNTLNTVGAGYQLNTSGSCIFNDNTTQKGPTESTRSDGTRTRTDSFVLAYCGDGICQSNETSLSCPADCRTISGNVYVDTNYNGAQDIGEIGYSGATVVLSGDKSQTTTTNPSGDYSFVSLTAGNYTTTLTVPAEYIASTTNPVDINLSTLDATVNFGISRVYSISGNIFIDDNKNERKNAGESNLSEVSNLTAINLLTSVATPLSTINGSYSFNDLFPGAYRVEYNSVPAYYSLTYPVNGPPPFFLVTVGPACSADPNPGHDSSCNASENIIDLNFGITNSIPWTQCQGADCRDDGGFTDPILGGATPTPTVTAGPTPTPGGLTVNPSVIDITPGNQGTSDVSGGTPPYGILTPPDGSIATTTINSNTITATGVAPGNTSVVVSDSSAPANTIEIGINVNSVVSSICGGPYASIPGPSSSTPGIIFTGDISANFGRGQASADPYNWLVGGTQYSEVYGPVKNGVIKTSYAYFTAQAKQNGITPTPLDTVQCGAGGLTSCNLSTTTLANGVYLANGDLTLVGTGAPPAYTFPVNKNYVILVNGDLHIHTYLYVPIGSTVTFSTTGSIYVDKSLGEADPCSNVTDVEGLFSTDKNFVVEGEQSDGSGGMNPISNCVTENKDIRLNIGGSVVVNAGLAGGKFTLQRDLCEDNLKGPAVAIIERPDFLLNAPEFIKHSNFVWQELSP